MDNRKQMVNSYIYIYIDKWLQTPQSFQLQIPPNLSAFNKVLMVLSLIGFSTGTWKEQLIRNFFNLYEAKKILKIPLYNIWPKDLLVWSYSKNVFFFVRSVYNLILNSGGNSFDCLNSLDSTIRKFWDSIWKNSSPPKNSAFSVTIRPKYFANLLEPYF